MPSLFSPNDNDTGTLPVLRSTWLGPKLLTPNPAGNPNSNWNSPDPILSKQYLPLSSEDVEATKSPVLSKRLTVILSIDARSASMLPFPSLSLHILPQIEDILVRPKSILFRFCPGSTVIAPVDPKKYTFWMSELVSAFPATYGEVILSRGSTRTK